jgi:sulfur-oxidizing protein SoxX
MRASAIAVLLLCAVSSAALADEPIKLAIVDHTVPQSLTGAPGDAAAGRKVVAARNLGNCIACHAISAMKSEQFHGDYGPSLDGVATRYNEAQLRMLLTDAKQIFPDTVMPAFHKNAGFNRVRAEFAGKPILTAAQVEDVVAFLKTLN